MKYSYWVFINWKCYSVTGDGHFYCKQGYILWQLTVVVMCHVSRVDRSDSDIFETLQHACTHLKYCFHYCTRSFLRHFFKATLKSSGAETVVVSLKRKKWKKWGRQAKTPNQWVENVKHALDLLLLFRDMFHGHKTCLAATPYIYRLLSVKALHICRFSSVFQA